MMAGITRLNMLESSDGQSWNGNDGIDKYKVEQSENIA
jgi:hypothetical protein